MNDTIGKEAEQKIKEWLDRPAEGYSFDRIYDQMTGFYSVSRNICDFTLYKYPYKYYIESKATWQDRWDFNELQDHQREGLLQKSKINGCFGWIIVLFASYQRAFKIDIKDFQTALDSGIKSINITKIDKWKIPYKEIQIIPNNRKKLLDYTGEVEDLI